MLGKEVLIFQKYLGFLSTPKKELAERHKELIHSTSLLNQVNDYLSKELKFDFKELEKYYNFDLTYKKWIDYEENVLIK